MTPPRISQSGVEIPLLAAACSAATGVLLGLGLGVGNADALAVAVGVAEGVADGVAVASGVGVGDGALGSSSTESVVTSPVAGSQRKSVYSMLPPSMR